MAGKVKIKKGKEARRQEQFWAMKSGGPYSKTDGDAKEIFKCTGCGAETEHENGWNGEPSKHNCHPGCPCSATGTGVLVAGGYSPRGRKNFDRIFPNAPGAGL